MNRLVAIAIRLIPSPVVSSKMWKSTCRRLSISALTLASELAIESVSSGAEAIGLAGSRAVVAREASRSAVVNTRVNILLNSSTYSELPTSPSSLRNSKEVMNARARVAVVI